MRRIPDAGICVRRRLPKDRTIADLGVERESITYGRSAEVMLLMQDGRVVYKAASLASTTSMTTSNG